MLVSRKLLNRYVDIADITTEELANRLTNAGLEVEGIDTLIKGTHLTIGHILECVPHPDSDHLSVCQVDLGSEVKQIVCGAPNVAQGQLVVVATVGAVLPGLTIKESEIRGQKSNGMICSLSELGVAEKYIPEKFKEGIVVLEKGTPGDDPRAALGMDDEVIDISQTPNRSDFLSMHAIAYEVAALLNRSVTIEDFECASDFGTSTQLKVGSETEKCRSFAGKVIRNVTIKESPEWIRAALIGSGIKPINNVVDISNLVMLETGQPMHFYDYDFLTVQNLTVRADQTLSVTGLDGKDYAIIDGDMLIMNEDRPVGIAGIMGLGNSMIHDKTTGLIIEIASFDMVTVRKTAMRLGLSTESSQRFSKPMDVLAPLKAMDRAVDLLIKYADATAVEETVHYNPPSYEPIIVNVELTRINKTLGTDFTLEQVIDVFQRLNLSPKAEGELITCVIPSYRNDLKLDVDLMEEVIRVIGYDDLKETLPNLDLTMGSLTDRQKDIQLIEQTLLGFGANQTVSYTLVEEAFTKGGETADSPISLMSPMSDKRTMLRTQLTPSLLEVVAYNEARKISNCFFFEISKIYTASQVTERLIVLGTGSIQKANWTKETTTLDFFALKGMLVSLMNVLGFTEKRITFKNQDYDNTMFNPYKTASVYLDQQRIGVLGHIHPQTGKQFGVKDAVVLEIDVATLFAKKRAAIKAQEISPYPLISRDLAILCDADVQAQGLIQVIEKASRRLLKEVNVFDVFTSEKLGNQKSYGVEMVFGSDRTLSVDEVSLVVADITAELVKKYAVTIR